MQKDMDQECKQIMEQLTLEEKVRVLSGVGSWHTYDCNGKLPDIMMSDGPHGLRKQVKEDYSDINKSEVATCFPTASAIASSWDLEVVKKLAKTLAKEALKEQVSIVLGCGTNIKRSPLCGRNFEYFSEDPYLAGRFATAYIQSMQEQGVGTSLKHFAGNNQETRRQTSNSQIDERALHEIYLTAFEMAVKEAQPTTIMASYNRLNGVYACANHHLLTDILRNEWKFEGTVVSDWGATLNAVKCIKAGMDLEMPDNLGIHTKQVMAAVESGELAIEEVDRAVKNVVKLILSQSKKLQDTTVNYKQHHEIAKELECKSAVLLKNEGVLPLKKGSKILVIGEMAENMRFQGGGSSHITTIKTENAVTSLRHKEIDVVYAQGYRSYKDIIDPKLEEEAVKAASENIPILFFGGLTDSFEGEGYDRTKLDIPSCQLSLMNKILKVNKNVTFVSFGGSPMLMPFLDQVKAVLHMYLGGQAVGEACAELLVGDINPSGKLAETFPRDLRDVPSYMSFGIDSDDLEYRESIFVGYRYYDTFHKLTLFDFGYGLSYTKFEYSNLKLDCNFYKEGNLLVQFTIKNVGECKGSEIAQVYVKNPKCNYLRASKELRGFTKVELAPGEEKEMQVMLNERSFSIYDENSRDFLIPSGEYEVCIGASINDIRLSQGIKVNGVTYNRDDRSKYPIYFELEHKDASQIQRQDFEALYERPLSHFDHIEKGDYTIYNSFQVLTRHSNLNKLIFSVLKRVYRHMNKGTPKDDPGFMMIMQAISEGPLDCLVCGSGGMFPVRLAEAIVLNANGRRLKGFMRLFRK